MISIYGIFIWKARPMLIGIFSRALRCSFCHENLDHKINLIWAKGCRFDPVWIARMLLLVMFAGLFNNLML